MDGTPAPAQRLRTRLPGVAQALLGYRSEARWLRFARKRLVGLFPYLPQQSGYDKRLRAALPLAQRVIRELAMDSDFRADTVWITDSTPVPCGMSRLTVQSSNVAGWAGYGYCASHSRFFWGLRLRLYLVCTPTGMPIMWAPADPEIGEREVLAAMLADPDDSCQTNDGGVQGDVGGDVGTEDLSVQGDLGQQGAADAVGPAEAVSLAFEEQEAVPHAAFREILDDARGLVRAADEIVRALEHHQRHGDAVCVRGG